MAVATIANVLKRNGFPTAPERQKETTWKEFVHSHMDVLFATDFFTTEVRSFIHLGTRRVHIGGITRYPHQGWMAQITRNGMDAEDGFLMENSCRYLIHDRDSKFCEPFDGLLRSVNIEPVKLPPRSEP